MGVPLPLSFCAVEFLEGGSKYPPQLVAIVLAEVSRIIGHQGTAEGVSHGPELHTITHRRGGVGCWPIDDGCL